MEVEVVTPTPYLSAPSTPKRFGKYHFRALDKYYDFDDFSVTRNDISVPFDWEEKPGTPKSPKHEDDFAFDVSKEMEKTALPAEELFDGGKIRPLKPNVPPRSSMSHNRGEKKELDPLTAVGNTREQAGNHRGRERVSSLSSFGSGRGGARSVSPERVSKYPWEKEEHKVQHKTEKSSSVVSKPNNSALKGFRKWRFKDFFLFRSASEGRAADKDPLRKYTALFRKHEEVKNSSFRSTECLDSGRRGRVSAHELHYTVNRAVSEDLKKKTFLPYKQGILGRLAFNPAVHALANGFGLSRR